MFDLTNIKQLHMETSSACNATCPWCWRENTNKFDKGTDTLSLTLEKVRTRFNEPFIKNLDSMFMCGNYGDPAAAHETIDILKYFREVNPKIELGIHSNGGLRSTKWWAELGTILSGERDYCYFGIDGLVDTNHLHRRGTLFTKIMDNATSFIKAGGKAHWEYLVFEHNEHQVEEARALSEAMGFVGFREKVSFRFQFKTVPGIRRPLSERYK